jgi:hypothetical protein
MYSQNVKRTKPYHTGRKTETTTSHIYKDYRSREEGCIDKMIKELNLTTLEERQKQ